MAWWKLINRSINLGRWLRKSDSEETCWGNAPSNRKKLESDVCWCGVELGAEFLSLVCGISEPSTNMSWHVGNTHCHGNISFNTKSNLWARPHRKGCGSTDPVWHTPSFMHSVLVHMFSGLKLPSTDRTCVDAHVSTRRFDGPKVVSAQLRSARWHSLSDRTSLYGRNHSFLQWPTKCGHSFSYSGIGHVWCFQISSMTSLSTAEIDLTV